MARNSSNFSKGPGRHYTGDVSPLLRMVTSPRPAGAPPVAPRPAHMKSLHSLLDPKFLPWDKNTFRPADPEKTRPGMFLEQAAFAGMLIVPEGAQGNVFSEVEPLYLHDGDVIIHRCGPEWTLHYVDSDLLPQDLACLVCTTDFHIRLRADAGISPETIFCQLRKAWNPPTPFNIRSFCVDTFIDTTVNQDEALDEITAAYHSCKAAMEHRAQVEAALAKSLVQ
jgi:hypothetical protein